jgi:hypothetical protein
MDFFSNLTPYEFLVSSLITAYILTMSLDHDEKLSFSNFIILVGFVMKNDAQQTDIYNRKKQPNTQNGSLERVVVNLSKEVQMLKGKVESLTCELNKRK